MLINMPRGGAIVVSSTCPQHGGLYIGLGGPPSVAKLYL